MEQALEQASQPREASKKLVGQFQNWVCENQGYG
jgi:hypothetical protein